MMFKKLIISSMVVLALVACKSTPKPTDPVKLTGIEATQTLVSKWSAGIGKTDTLAFAPVYLQGGVYAASENGRIYEFDYSSGRTLLSLDTKTKLMAGVAIAGDLVFVGDQNARLLAFSRTTQNKVWEQPLTTVLSEAPVLVGSILVTKTKDGRLSGFDPETGKTLWTFANTQPVLSIRNTGTITPVSEQLFLTAEAGGRLVVINAQNGETVWGVIVAAAKGASDLERVTEVLSRPITADGQVCAAAYQGRVACFEAQTGKTIWAQPASSSKGIDVVGALLVLTEDSGIVKAYNRSNGQVYWQSDALKNRQVSAPVILPNGILVTDYEGYAHLFDFQSGSIIARTKFSLGSLTAQPERIEGYALLQGQKGNLMLISSGATQ